MDHLCKLGVAFFLMLTALTFSLLALLTDNWYHVTTDPDIDPEVKQRYNYHFGLWRLCYDRMPKDMAADPQYRKEGSSCIFIYRQLLHRQEHTLDDDARLRLHLSRTVMGGSIAEAAFTLFAVLSLMCGVWPSSKLTAARQGCVFLGTAILLLLATMSGITSGVSFIAVRDLDNTVARREAVLPTVVPSYAGQEYDWSFVCHWAATALVFLDSLLVVCLMRTSYQYIDDGAKMKSIDSF